MDKWRRSNDGYPSDKRNSHSPRENHNNYRKHDNVGQQAYMEDKNHNHNNHQQNNVHDLSNTNYASLVKYVQDSWNKIMTENVEYFNNTGEPIRN